MSLPHATAVALFGLLVVVAGVPASAAPVMAVAPDASGSAYRPPVGGAVLRLFDPPAVPWGRGHRGVDLAAPDGEVRSPGPGVVSFSGVVAGRGVVTVLHPDGLRSSLEPVDGAPQAGTPVEAGEPIGTLGATAHCRAGPCVHWGVRRGETYLDPLGLLGDATVVLLP